MELCNSQNRRTDCRGAAMGAAACWLRRRHDRPAKGIISNIVSRVLYAAGHPIAQLGAPITIGAYQFLVKVPSILRCRKLGFSMPMHSDGKKRFAVCSFL